MNRKLSIKILIIGALIILYYLYQDVVLVHLKKEHSKEFSRRTNAKIQSAMNIADKLLEEKCISCLEVALMELTTGFDGVDYYLLLEDDRILAQYNVSKTDEHLAFVKDKTPSAKGIFDSEELGIRYLRISHENHVVYIGYKTDKKALQRFIDGNYKYLRLADWAIWSFCIIVVIFIFFRPLTRSLQNLMTFREQRNDKGLNLSMEETLISGTLEGYEEHIHRLSLINAQLRQQIHPSILVEMASGKATPYQFNCTMIRTDINNFSEIWHKYGEEAASGTAIEFLRALSEVMTRYSGLTNLWAGDEAVYYFKDEISQNSAFAAVCALREVNIIAAEFNDYTMKKYGFHFTIKSAIGYGQLRFGHGVDQLENTGHPFVKSQRYLKAAETIKASNPIIYDDEVRQKLDGHQKDRFLARVSPKGLDETDVYALESISTLKDFLQKQTPESFAMAGFFRSDEEVVMVLRFIIENRKTVPRNLLLILINNFSSFYVKASDENVFATLEELLKVLMIDFKEGHHGAEFLLSSVLSKARSFIESKDVPLSLLQTISSCTEIGNERVVANSFELADLVPELKTKKTPLSHHRVQATSIINQSHLAVTVPEWEKLVYKKLRSMIKHKSPYHVSSGLYALGEIALSFRLRDAAVFKNSLLLRGLLDELKLHYLDDDDMVRTQAMQAAWKAGQVEELRSLLQRTDLEPSKLRSIQSFLAQKGQVDLLALHALDPRIRRLIENFIGQRESIAKRAV